MPVAPHIGLIVAGVSLALLLLPSTRCFQTTAFSAFGRLRPERASRTQMAQQLEETVGRTPAKTLRFRVLLLDHDDTTVRGTEEVHYPAHVESVKLLRPDLEAVSLDGWFLKNHEPGVSNYLKSLFTSEQMVEEHEIWHRAMEGRVPAFYEGMPELLSEFRARGGRVAVVSHSPASTIWRHYEAHPLAERIRPDLVLGWDNNPEKRKPAVWPALHALEQLGVAPSEALVVDDLSPGVKMAKAAGVATAGAGWGHSVPAIEGYMRQECNHYFVTVQELAGFLFGPDVPGASSL